MRKGSNPGCKYLMIPSIWGALGSITFPNPSTYLCMSNTDNDIAKASHNDDWARFMPGPVKQAIQTQRINDLGHLGKQ